MIYNNLRPGTYQMKIQSGGLSYPEGERAVKSPEDGRDLAEQIEVATEANFVMKQMEALSNGVVGLDDSPFDLNHTDKDTVILVNAPLEDEDNTDALGMPQVKGFLDANIQGAHGGRISFREKGGSGEVVFNASQPAPNKAVISRTAPNSNPMTISINMETGDAEVTVDNNPMIRRRRRDNAVDEGPIFPVRTVSLDDLK